MSQMFLSDSNKIRSFSTDFLTSPQHQILQISTEWERRLYTRKDGRTDMQLTGTFRGTTKCSKNLARIDVFVSHSAENNTERSHVFM